MTYTTRADLLIAADESIKMQNPPKPKTVMVELTREQAELGAKLGLTTDICFACRKALGEKP